MILKEKKIKKFIKLFLEKLNVPGENAKIISKYLVEADMSGHYSHGINRIFQYENAIKNKVIVCNSKIRLKQKGNFLEVDGKFNFGQIVMTEVCKYLKRKKNINFVSVKNSAHIGRLSDYVEELSKNGYVALFFASGGGPNVAPFPIQERLIGTNPFAFSFPINKKNPFVVDFSTASMAEGKINIALKSNKKLPHKAIINKFGKFSNKPIDLYSGGSIVPFGGHKGSAFSLVIEYLSGLSISKNLSFKKNYRDGNNCFLIIFKKKFLSSEMSQLNFFEKKLKSSKKIKNYRERIYLPGEIEKCNFLKSRKNGIYYSNKLINSVKKLALEKYNLKF